MLPTLGHSFSLHAKPCPIIIIEIVHKVHKLCRSLPVVVLAGACVACLCDARIAHSHEVVLHLRLQATVGLV